METIYKILAFAGTVETIIFLAGLIGGFVLWTRGILPVLVRIGNGLAKRKIVILAKGDNVNSLTTLLIDSGLFLSKNISAITKTEDLGRTDGASVYLVYWHDFASDIEQILLRKPDKCPMVVYAPYDKGRIPDEQMTRIDGKRHTAVTNFRGRLLNDIVTAMITTSYEQ